MVRWMGLVVVGFLAGACELRGLPDGAQSGIVERPASGAGGQTGGIVSGESPGTVSGSGGTSGGTGGATSDGAGGGPGSGPPSCSELEARYVAAVEEDKSCDPTLNVSQCLHVVIPSLCGGCSVHVNDTAASTAVRLQWDRVPCPLPPRCGPSCPASPLGARCVPTDTGTGRCVEVAP